MGNQFFVGNLCVFCQSPGEIEIRCRILIAPKRRGNGGDHQGNLSIRDAKERSRAPFENVRVRALRFPGKPVEGRERGDPACRSRENATEESQRFRERFGTAVRIGHKKSRTP